MNLYWTIYKDLELEVEKLTHSIFFDDTQLNVYSLEIANLIIRCAVEIESITKELYYSLGGTRNPVDASGNERDLYFDTDCIQLLVEKWHIDKKKITIKSSTMYFSEGKSVLLPLHKAHKRGSSGSKWNKAYQAIKHDRNNSIGKATVENLLHALGALYILNVYYKYTIPATVAPIAGVSKVVVPKIEQNDSLIFAPQIIDGFVGISLSVEMENVENMIGEERLDEAIFIDKLTDNAFRKIHESICKDTLNVAMTFGDSDEYRNHIALHPEDASLNVVQVAEKLKGGMPIMLWDNSEFRKVVKEFNNRETILNKHEGIYPELRYEDYLAKINP